MKKNTDKSRSEGGNNVPKRKKASSKNGEIEICLSSYCEFRYNTILGRTEYRSENDTHFSRVGRYEINTLRREIDNDIEIIASSKNLYSIIESSFSPRINPIQEYFKGLSLVDVSSISPFSLKAIPHLTSCVVVHSSDKWLQYLTRWLMAVVVNTMSNRECCNHTCLVLAGKRGKFGTTSLNLLRPPTLHGYNYTSKVYPQGKDALTYIGQDFIVDISDQLKALNRRDENKLKNLITCPMVKYHMPHDKCIEEHLRLSNFVASVNGNNFLTDPVGSRCFLPSEVPSIDTERVKVILMNNVYAEAKALLKSGLRYWFNNDEIAELYRESEDFQVQAAEMELLLRCFEELTEGESYSLTATTEILAYLSIYAHQPLVAERMGEALKKAGYIKMNERKNGGSPIYVYRIREILPCPLLQTYSSQM